MAVRCKIQADTARRAHPDQGYCQSENRNTHWNVTDQNNRLDASGIIRLVGCLWLAIAVLSVLGLIKPATFAPILLVQLIYKGSWLLLVAIPSIRNGVPYPSGMAVFFLIWVLVLPFIIPWSVWLNRN